MQPDKDLKSLDTLIADLGGADAGTRSQSSCGLLLEHLQAARRDLLGSMRGEYRLSLREANESAVCISDKSVRAGIKERLRGLIDSEALPKPGPLVPAV